MFRCCNDILSTPGQFVLSSEHRASSHHQAEGDPPGGVQPLHEGGQGHPDPGASSGNPVCPAPLQAFGSGLLWNLRLHHAHFNALPGETAVREGAALRRLPNEPWSGNTLFGIQRFPLASVCTAGRKAWLIWCHLTTLSNRSPLKPHSEIHSDIYSFSIQGLLVATIFCFFNGEVSPRVFRPESHFIKLGSNRCFKPFPQHSLLY